MGLPLLVERSLDHDLGFREAAARLARRKTLVRDQIVRQGVVDQRRAGRQRTVEIGHRVEFVIFDADEFGGIFRKVAIPRNDADHGIADETNLVDRQRGKLDRAQTLDRRRHPQGRRPSGEFAPRNDGDDALGLARGLDIDGPDPGMRVRRADEMRVERARHHDIVEIAALSGDEAIVLATQQRLADGARFAHAGWPSRRRAAAFAIAATMLW